MPSVRLFLPALVSRQTGSAPRELKTPDILLNRPKPLCSLGPVIEFPPRDNSPADSWRRSPGPRSPLYAAAFGFIFLAQLNSFLFLKTVDPSADTECCLSQPPTASNLGGLLCFCVNKDVE